MLGGGPVQYREVQGSESQLFLSYFKDSGGIEYLPGGVESGFRKVERDVYPVRLLHLKGKRTVRVAEVPVALGSLNRGDVFILDLGLKIFLFNGSEANKYEKVKGIEVASRINNDERGARAEIIVLDDEPQNAEFWGHFGGYTTNLPQGADDEEVASTTGTRKLFRISDASGAMAFEDITPADGKLTKTLLDGNDVFLVQSPAPKFFLWVGKKSNLNEKKEATQLAVKHLAACGLPNSTAIERVSEGSESGAFKAEFTVWDEPRSFGYKAKASSGAATTAIDEHEVAKLVARKAEEDTPVDDGSGKLTIWRIENFEKVPVDPASYGQFFGGDCYILLYTYSRNKRTEEHLLYFWLGNESTPDEKGAAALLTVKLDDEMGGKPVQVRVTQGKEPAHFRQLFKGKMVVYKGGHASGFSSGVGGGDQEETALFHVRGSDPLNTVGLQVPLSAASLNGEDCFLLVSNDQVFAWSGSASNEAEKTVALNLANILAGSYRGTAGRAVVTVQEHGEPDEFWALLGGKQEYASASSGESIPREPRLFSASTATGRFKVEEIDNFDQSDLNDEDVFLLDTYTQLFVWVGSQSTNEEKEKAVEFAKKFIAAADDGRDVDMPIVRVAAGEEPRMFSSHFHGWDAEYTQKRKFQDPYQARLQALAAEKAKAKAANETAARPALKSTPSSKNIHAAPAPAAAPAASSPSTSTKVAAPANATPGAFTYEQLKGQLPDGVDPAQKEEYLSDKEFNEVFGTDRASFRAMPKWKRDDAKRKKGLF